MDNEEWGRLETLATATSSAERGLGDSLCTTCKHSVIFRRKERMDVIVRCGMVERVVPSDVHECSAYDDVNSMSLYEMKQIALDVDPRRGVNDKSYL